MEISDKCLKGNFVYRITYVLLNTCFTQLSFTSLLQTCDCPEETLCKLTNTGHDGTDNYIYKCEREIRDGLVSDWLKEEEEEYLIEEMK